MKSFGSGAKTVEGKFTVYAHVLGDVRRYIGITSQKPERRWRKGEGYKLRGTESYFYRAIQKYGWDSFSHVIIAEGLSEEEAKKREIQLISEYMTQDRRYGFNLSGGGEGGFNPSEETIKKIGENSRLVNTGRHHTKEYKRMMSERMKRENPNAGGKLMTKERVEKFREYAKKPKTEIQKRRMSESAKKHKIICVETGEIFESMKQAANCKGICYTSLTSAVYNSNRRAGGFRWKTYEEF